MEDLRIENKAIEEEPVTKKPKCAGEERKVPRLEDRLNGILCCAVCLDLPSTQIFQVG